MANTTSCLMNSKITEKMLTGLNHLTLAFNISATDFPLFVERLRSANVQEWRNNRSEGASFYFLDPDGHKLEAHVGDLASRLATCRQQPYAGMKFFDDL